MTVNKVFAAIKSLCTDPDTELQAHDCFVLLTGLLDMKEKELTVYLDVLENMKLIRYEKGNLKTISLTPLGKRTTKINESVS